MHEFLTRTNHQNNLINLSHGMPPTTIYLWLRAKMIVLRTYQRRPNSFSLTWVVNKFGDYNTDKDFHLSECVEEILIQRNEQEN